MRSGVNLVIFVKLVILVELVIVAITDDSGESGDSDEFCQNQVNLMILVWSGFWNMAGNVEIWWKL